LYPKFFLDDTFWKFSDIFSQQHFSEVLPIFFVNIFGSVANIFSQHFLEVCQYFFPSIVFRQHFSEALPILLGVLPTFSTSRGRRPVAHPLSARRGPTAEVMEVSP
jgi:hypothetical protein